MKKMNAKGFTLIELLAVITIMGILMLVAIPAVSRTIENSRKDTFIDTMKSYVNGAKNLWASDNLMCGEHLSSAVANGTYYIAVDTKRTDVPVLLEQGGKSSWGNRDISGYIKVEVSGEDADRKIEYYPVLSDGVHGVNLTTSGEDSGNLKEGDALVRGLIKNNVPAVAIPAGTPENPIITCVEA